MIRAQPHEIDLSGLDVERYLWAIRFWSKVDRSGGDESCWLWTGTIKRDSGHGLCNRYGRRRETVSRTQLAHRIAYDLLIGPIPDGKVLMHKCDVPNCVNPNHLVPGTQTENMHDMWAKGRGRKPPRNSYVPTARRGVDHPMAKIGIEQVQEIRARRAAGETLVSIATSHGVSSSLVSMIALGKIWKEAA